MNIFNNRYFWISLFVFIMYISPFILLGEDTYIRIHDNLDSSHIWFKVLAQSDKIFSGSYELVPIFMNAPRVALENEINIQLWLFYFFDSYTALAINQIFLRIFACIGMYLYLNKYVFRYKFQNYSIFVSLLFSLLPFWSPAGLTVSGIPFLVYSFLNIRRNKFTIIDLLVLLIYQMYSVFYHGGVFVILVAAVIWLCDIYNGKRIKHFTISLLFFSIVGLLINYRIIDSFFIVSDYTSHRVEQLAVYNSFYKSISISLHHFFQGQTHTQSIHTIFLPFIVIMFIFSMFSKFKNSLLNTLFWFAIFISLFYGFWSYEGWKNLKETFHFLIPLNLGRLYNISPFVWYSLLAVSIKYYLENDTYINSKIGSFFRINNIKLFQYRSSIKINILLFISLIYIFVKSDFVQGFLRSYYHYPTYKEFYSKSLFLNIDKFIGEPKASYKVISLGLHPSVSQYNGFHTLDAYSSNYSLNYKHEFRKIMTNELKKSNKLKKYFDNWGNRCYLFTKEGRITSYYNPSKRINIDINATQIYNMGGRYIFSIHLIQNADENSIKLVNIFNEKKYSYQIFLYKVLNKNNRQGKINEI